MHEILPGIYKIGLESTSEETTTINIYLIPDREKGRALMIDAGYRSPENVEKLRQGLKTLGLQFSQLDVFLTHKHHDHTGMAHFLFHQGARILMNPDEDRHPYDCLYYNNTEEAIIEQEKVLKTVGVTPIRTPELWERFMQMNRAIHEEAQDSIFLESQDYQVHPIYDGEEFCYGGYSLKAVLLKGHTYGQMGLMDDKHKIIFPADQFIKGIVPIVGTAYFGEELLSSYLKSVEEFPKRFEGYTVYPSHMEPFDDLQEVADRILRSYRKKIDQTYRFVQEHPGKKNLVGMTTKEVAFLIYGLAHDLAWENFYQTKMIITKTFSCLEYLREEGKVDVHQAVLEKDRGILFWTLSSAES